MVICHLRVANDTHLLPKYHKKGYFCSLKKQNISITSRHNIGIYTSTLEKVSTKMGQTTPLFL